MTAAATPAQRRPSPAGGEHASLLVVAADVGGRARDASLLLVGEPAFRRICTSSVAFSWSDVMPLPTRSSTRAELSVR